MKRIVAGLALAAVILATVMAFRGNQEMRAGIGRGEGDAARAVQERYGGVRLPSDAVLAIAPGGGAAHAPAATSKLTPVMQEYARAKGYKALHDRLAQSSARTPEENWLLAEILERCAKVREHEAQRGPRWSLGGAQSKEKYLASLSPKDPNRERRIAAFDQLNVDPCAGLTDLEVSEKDIRSLYAQGAAAGDPKSRVALVQHDLQDSTKDADGKSRQDVTAVTISEAQFATVKDAATSGDPYALLAAARILGGPMQNLSLRAGEAELPVDFTAFYGAATLTACDAGYPCGPDSRQLVSACALQGQCGAGDYREYLYYYRNSPNSSQLIGEYQAGLARAIRDGDWSYFTFHRGPSSSFAPYQPR
jgi:hypothetical protein